MQKCLIRNFRNRRVADVQVSDRHQKQTPPERGLRECCELLCGGLLYREPTFQVKKEFPVCAQRVPGKDVVGEKPE